MTTHSALEPALAASTAVPERSHRRSDAAWQFLATALVWGTALAAVALWVSMGGVQDLGALGATALTSLSRLTGLVSADLLLLQALFMAQIPLFERGFGRAGMTRAHRLTGMWSFYLLLAHIVLIVIAYAMSDGMNVFAETWNITWTYPGVLLAVIGTLLLVMVMISSARRIRTRVRYEGWHLLHLYAYVGVGVAVPHMLWTGDDFVSHPAASAFYWTVWGVAAGAIIVFRVIRPLARSAWHGLRVAEVRADGRDGVTVLMTGRRLHGLHARAGQFFVWRFLDGPGWTRGHPFSLSAAPTHNTLQITARVVGDGTRRLTDLKPGTKVLVEGSFGIMTNESRSGTTVLMLASGAGISPLISMLEARPFSPGRAVLVTRDHTAADRMRAGAINDLVRDRGLVHYPLDGPRMLHGATWLSAQYQAWDGAQMLQYLAPAHNAETISQCDVYVCGPDSWSHAVIRDLHRAGFTRSHIHTESFNSVPLKG